MQLVRRNSNQHLPYLERPAEHTYTQTITPSGHWVIPLGSIPSAFGIFFNSHSMMTFNKSSYAHCSQVNQFWLGALPSPFSVCARIPNGRSIFVLPRYLVTHETKLWHNNPLSRRFGKYSFQTCGFNG